MNAEVWAAIAAVLAAVIGYVGVRYTANQSNRAAAIAKDVEKAAVDAAAYERARESYDAAIDRYLKEIERLTVQIDITNRQLQAKFEEVAHLEKSRKEQRYEIEATVEQLIEARREHEMHLHECVRRVARLRRRLQLADPTIDPTDPDLFG